MLSWSFFSHGLCCVFIVMYLACARLSNTTILAQKWYAKYSMNTAQYAVGVGFMVKIDKKCPDCGIRRVFFVLGGRGSVTKNCIANG